MAFHNFSRSGESIEMTIRDQNGKKIETFKCGKKDFHHFASLIEQKYGIDVKPEISNSEDINSLNNLKKKEINWLSTDNDYI